MAMSLSAGLSIVAEKMVGEESGANINLLAVLDTATASDTDNATAVTPRSQAGAAAGERVALEVVKAVEASKFSM